MRAKKKKEEKKEIAGNAAAGDAAAGKRRRVAVALAVGDGARGGVKTFTAYLTYEI